MRHPYIIDCTCPRCQRERTRREQQSHTISQVMLKWSTSRSPWRRRISQEYWDAYEAGRPTSDNDR